MKKMRAAGALLFSKPAASPQPFACRLSKGAKWANIISNSVRHGPVLLPFPF
jgi:hypothetical protein